MGCKYLITLQFFDIPIKKSFDHQELLGSILSYSFDFLEFNQIKKNNLNKSMIWKICLEDSKKISAFAYQKNHLKTVPISTGKPNTDVNLADISM